MKIAFVILLLLHATIHLFGFLKAFDIAEMPQLSKGISKTAGIFWLLATVLFFTAAIMFWLQKEQAPIICLLAIVISQVLIISVWQDAKFATIINVLALFVSMLWFASLHFQNQYRADVSRHLQQTSGQTETLITENDLSPLPVPVQKYLRYAGVVNKPVVKNFKVDFIGQMRTKGKDFFPFISEQYNFIDEPARLFFMKAKMFGNTVPGYHKYENAKASMDIRLFGLISVVQHSGTMMNKTETVTFFNDMCLLAPGSLIDKRIQWKAINDASCQAIFTNHAISISATLYFNKEGQLVNFISSDRADIDKGINYPFSTPVSEYKAIKGHPLFYKGDAVWTYPDGKFVYGKFTLKDISYNVK